MKIKLNHLASVLALFAGLHCACAQQLFDANDTPAQKVQMLTFRGYTRAESGRWQDAAADLSAAIAIDPSDHITWFFLTPLLVQEGKIADYKTHSQEMLHRFKDTDTPEIAERAAKSSLLLPGAVGPDDLALADKLADRALKIGKGNPWYHWFQLTKGLAEYRQRHFEKAIKWMERIQDGREQKQDAGWPMCKADTYFIAAMVQYQLKHADKARTALTTGNRIVDAELPKLDSGNLGQSWLDILEAYIFQREAKELIEAKPAQ